MSQKRFYVRLQLQLHAVTCPGVWLCSHGYLEATVKTLGYYFRTGAMEPRFPMLCHDRFTMEGYFKHVDSLEKMREMLNSEQLEITLWQNGRRLAYYIGRLSDVMQPPIPRLSCEHSANVQLLMKATTAFPGILAPKVELSADLRAKDKQCGDCCKVDLQRPLNNRHVESRCMSRLEMPRKQQPVCHAKQSNCGVCSPTLSYSQATQQHRRLSTCSSSTQMSTQSQTLSQDSCQTQCSHTYPSSISDAAEHQSTCHICQAYRRLFHNC